MKFDVENGATGVVNVCNHPTDPPAAPETTTEKED